MSATRIACHVWVTLAVNRYWAGTTQGFNPMIPPWNPGGLSQIIQLADFGSYLATAHVGCTPCPSPGNHCCDSKAYWHCACALIAYRS
jgi:hypothetical protein